MKRQCSEMKLKYIKMYKTLLLVFVVSFSLPLNAQEIIDKVIAQVGSEYILLSDVEKQYSYLADQEGVVEEDVRCQILESLMSQKVMIDQARLDSVVVQPQEVEAQLEYRIQDILGRMNGNEELFQQYYGQTVQEVKLDMRQNIEDMLLTQRMQTSLMDAISITPKETRAFFDKIPKDSLPYFSAEVEVAEIVLVPEVNEEERQIALDRINELRGKIVTDKMDFAKVAEKYSHDPGSKRLGGDLGWKKRGTFVPEFEAVAYDLEVGQLSEPFESPFGYHIIELLGRRGNIIHVRHILVTPDITQADLDKTKEKLNKIKVEIESDSLTFTEALRKYGFKDVQSYTNNGRLMNPQNGTTFFEAGNLSPDIYFAIEGLKVGDITDPIEFANEKNETNYRIVKLLSNTKPHRANLKEDYAKIQFFAKENKKNAYLNKWLEKKIGNTYIRIDEKYAGCPNLEIWNRAAGSEE